MSDEEDIFAILEKEMVVPTCDSPNHDRSGLHKGPAEWYFWTQCPMCGNESDKEAVCHPYLSVLPVLMELAGPSVVECNVCHSSFFHTYSHIRTERR